VNVCVTPRTFLSFCLSFIRSGQGTGKRAGFTGGRYDRAQRVKTISPRCRFLRVVQYSIVRLNASQSEEFEEKIGSRWFEEILAR